MLPPLAAVVIVIAIGLKGWLTLAQASLLRVDEPATRRRAGRGESRALAVCRLLETREFLSSVMVAASVLVLFIAALVTVLLQASTWSPAYRALVHLGLVLFLVVFAELTARRYASLFPEQVAYRLAPGLVKFLRVLSPLARLLRGACRALPGRREKAGGQGWPQVTTADIQAAADLSEESGEVEPEVGKMLDEVVELFSTTVREIMTPRVEIVGLPAEAATEEIMAVVIESGFSRLPVYEGDLDNLIGILYVNDFIARLARQEDQLTARELARPALRTPPTKRVNEMLWEMREQATHLAVVVDESGGTEGLVTIEDILEELVGEIEDEHDVPDEDLVAVAPGEIIVEGKVRLDEVEEALDLRLPPTESETVAGLITWLLGRIPQEGERVTYAGLHLQVEEGNGQQVKKVRITRLTEEAD